MGHVDITSAIIIASAFGDAGAKVIGFLTEIRPALLAIIVLSTACAVVFSKGHKMEILGGGILACVLLMGMTTLGASF